MTFFSSPITTARASVGTYISAAGSLTSFAANELRVGDVGALIEPAATQLLHETDALTTQDETVTAQPYTLHFRGTGQIVLTGAHSATLTGTGATDLVSLTFTPSAGTLTITPSGTVDFPQLEVGSYATSYIPNLAASGTSTRAADLVTSGAVADEFSAVIDFVMPYAQPPLDFNVLFQTDDGTDTARLFCYVALEPNQIYIAITGGAGSDLLIGNPTAGIPQRVYLSWVGGVMTARITGGATVTQAGNTFPTGLTKIRYGSAATNKQLAGGVMIEDVAIYGRALTTSEIDALFA